MKTVIQTIPVGNLILAIIPVIAVIVILYKWSLKPSKAFHAVLRMFTQLLLIGYFLTYIFDTEKSWLVLIILSIMLLGSSWISLNSIKENRRSLFAKALSGIAIGGGLTLLLVTQVILELDPWYMPRYMVPLAGMIFSNSMNSVSLAAERLTSEMSRGMRYSSARGIALNAALIPITNSLFAVGIVSLPGMMTGQILAGVDPLIAVRYQIMVMCMAYGSAGISSALFIHLSKKQVIANQDQSSQAQ